jgi:hypothetical protein
MDKHVTVVAVLNLIFGVLGCFTALILFVIIAGGGLLGSVMSNEALPAFITGAVGTVIAMLITLFSVPGIIGGLGLLNRKPWARILMLILGFLGLLNIPFGTVLGIYTIWVMLNDETVRLFGG